MAQDQKVKLTFKMSDDTTKDVEFIVPGGKDGTDAGLPAVPKTVIDTATPMADVQAAMLSLLQNPATAAANTQWNNVTYPNYPDITGQVRLTVIPAESGKYLYIGGDLNYPGQGVASMAWASDDGQTTSTMFESFDSGPQIDASLVGTGLFDKLRVQISQSAGNGLSLQTDGLFAVAGGLPALPAAPLGDQITPQEFDDKVSQLLNSTGPTGSPNAEHYGMNVGDYGGFHAYLVSIPVPGEGFYVLASGYIQDNPPTKLDLQAYVSTAGGEISDPTYITNDRTDMSLLLRPLTLYSSDSTVTVTQDGNDWDLKGRTLKRGATSGNWGFGYSDNPSASSAAGRYGSSIYLKTTITLNNANNGDVGVAVDVVLDSLPCQEDGTLVPYTVWAGFVSASGQSKPTVVIWLNCPTPPTHLINPTTKAITKLQRTAGQGSGLASVYPEAPEGEAAHEFQYILRYWYTA